MYSKAHLQSLGQALKERREDQGLSLEKVSEWTKISVDTLKAVEDAQVERFPVYTYLRGFILAYAKAVGIDEKEIEKELKTLAPQKENSDIMEVSPVSSSPSDLIEKDIRLTPILLAVLILVVLGSILVFSNVIKTYNKSPIPFEPEETEQTEEVEVEGVEPETKQPEETPPPLPQSGSDEKEENQTDTEEESETENKEEEKTDKEPDSSADSSKKTAKEFEIIVKAVKNTEVVYQVDKDKRKTLSLKADQFEVLKGQKNIFIKTKDSDSIYIFYNGENKGLFGPGGKKEKEYTPEDL